MMVIPVMVTGSPTALETIGTMVIHNKGTTYTNREMLYEVTWTDEYGKVEFDLRHQPDDGALVLLAMAANTAGSRRRAPRK